MARFTQIFSKEKKKDTKVYSKEQKAFLNLGEYLPVFAAFMVAFLLLFRIVMVDGRSMNRSLLDGDRVILISRTVYRTPECGDVVVVSKDNFENGKNLIKRVIATEGQTVDIDFDNRTVYVDGVALDEPYVYYMPGDSSPMHAEGMAFPLQVPQGCVFVMGDNRNDSLDSRSPKIGLIDEREILGKAVFLFWPGANMANEPLDFTRLGGID